jgi:hypothetical protein
MGNFESAGAVAVQKCRSRSSDPRWKTGRIGMLPVGTENSAVGGVDSYRDTPVIPASVQIHVHDFASTQSRLLFAYGGFARIEELGPDRVWDIHRFDIT